MWRGANRATQMIGLYRNWPLALVDRAGLLGTGRQIQYRLRDRAAEDGTVALKAESGLGDVRVINEQWLGNPYLRHVSPTSSWPQVAVDLGAHKGYFATYLAMRNPGIELHCFEPHPRNFELLQENLHRNGIRAESLARAAITPKEEGPVDLFIGVGSHLHTIVSVEEAPERGLVTTRYTGEQTRVPSISVSTALEGVLDRSGAIGLLKLDVEGLELELLLATPNSVLARTWAIAAEVGYATNNLSETVVRLKRVGLRTRLEPPYLWAWRDT
jgi:FkbM family methyltransferase